MKKTSFPVFLFLMSAFVFLQAGCSMNSQVEFKGSRALGPPAVDNLKSQIAPTQGGFLARKTSGNYTSSLTMGSKTNSVQAVTTGGYKVRFDIQSRIVQ